MNELIASYIPLAFTIIGLMALVVSVIVEVIKGIPGLAKVPTDLVVIVLSVGLAIVVFVTYMNIKAYAITWYLVLGAIVAGFFVAFIAMYGWDKLTTLYDRFSKYKKLDE